MIETNIKSELHAYFENQGTEVELLNIGYNDFNKVKDWRFLQVRDVYSLHYVFSGSGQIIIDGKIYEIKKKQFFYVPVGVKMAYYPNENDKWRYVWFNFTGEQAESFVTDLGFSKDKPVRDNSNDLLEEELLSLVKTINEDGEIGYYKAKSALYLVAEELSLTGKSEKIKSVAEKAKNLIKLNYRFNSFNLERVAESLHVSLSYLSKVFKEKFGITASAYLINLRLSEAEKLLKETLLTAKEIGFSVGYNDEIHFLKQFKKKFGVTTGIYRKNQNKER